MFDVDDVDELIHRLNDMIDAIDEIHLYFDLLLIDDEVDERDVVRI